MPKGKKSTQAKLEDHFGEPISKIIKQFEGMETSVAVAKKVETITEGKVTATSLTMERLASSLSLSVKHHPWSKPKAKGKRGKQSIRERLEVIHKKDIWNILKPYKNQTKEAAAKSLGVSAPSLAKMIQSALDNRDDEATPYEAWTIKRPRGRKSSKVPAPPTKIIPVILECTKCGHKKATATAANLCFAPHWNTAARAKRCQECQQWGNFNLTIKAEEGEVYIVSNLPPIGTSDMYEYYETDKSFKKRKAR